MRPETVWSAPAHDPKDPSPWLALSLDESVPLHSYVKGAWLNNEDSWSRQFLLPVVRPLARLVIILIQLIKILIPNAVSSSWLLHRILALGLKTFVRPEANYLILRHFWIGSENLAFIAANVPGVEIPLSPLRPRTIDDLKDHLFVKHDLNLFNFVINLNREMKAARAAAAANRSAGFLGHLGRGFPARSAARPLDQRARPGNGDRAFHAPVPAAVDGQRLLARGQFPAAG